jgi:hypothetical protein
MAKKAKVQLFGLQNRGIDVNIDATQGAVVGENLYWPDGTLVTQTQIVNNTTVVTVPGGEVVVTPTLWELILNMPAFIKSLGTLATVGLVVRSAAAGGTALARSLVGETGRIVVTNGDAVAGDPTITLGPWPTVKPKVDTAEVARIPTGHQMLVWDNFEIVGDIEIEPEGELVILGDQPELEPIEPNFTYSGGQLSQIDYSSGEQKVFSYNGGGQLEQLDFISDGWTLRKLFFYTGGGDLDYITQEYL